MALSWCPLIAEKWHPDTWHTSWLIRLTVLAYHSHPTPSKSEDYWNGTKMLRGSATSLLLPARSGVCCLLCVSRPVTLVLWWISAQPWQTRQVLPHWSSTMKRGLFTLAVDETRLQIVTPSPKVFRSEFPQRTILCAGKTTPNIPYLNALHLFSQSGTQGWAGGESHFILTTTLQRYYFLFSMFSKSALCLEKVPPKRSFSNKIGKQRRKAGWADPGIAVQTNCRWV